MTKSSQPCKDLIGPEWSKKVKEEMGTSSAHLRDPACGNLKHGEDGQEKKGELCFLGPRKELCCYWQCNEKSLGSFNQEDDKT